MSDLSIETKVGINKQAIDYLTEQNKTIFKLIETHQHTQTSILLTLQEVSGDIKLIKESQHNETEHRKRIDKDFSQHIIDSPSRISDLKDEIKKSTKAEILWMVGIPTACLGFISLCLIIFINLFKIKGG
jgi:hypothetical protein